MPRSRVGLPTLLYLSAPREVKATAARAIGRPKYYGASELAVQYLVAARGEASLAEMVRRLRAGQPFPAAFLEVYGLTEAGLQRELMTRLR